MFLVLRIRRPIEFAVRPREYLFEEMMRNERQKRRQLFDTVMQVTTYIQQQQIMLPQQHFVAMQLERMLLEKIMRKQMHDFFAQVMGMHYYSPAAARPRQIRFHQSAGHTGLDQESNDFVRAQTASMNHSQPERRHVQPTAPVAPVQAVANDLPRDLKLSESDLDSLKKNEFACPISMNEQKDISQFSLVRLSSGISKLYEADSIKELAARSNDGTFLDPQTREKVSVSNVTTVPASVITAKFGTPAATTPAQSQEEPQQAASFGSRR